MGAPLPSSVRARESMYKVGLLVALVAITVHAAPLYDQQVEEYESMLMQEDKAPKKAGKPVAKKAAKTVAKTAKAVVVGDTGPLPMDTISKSQDKQAELNVDAINKEN